MKDDEDMNVSSRSRVLLGAVVIASASIISFQTARLSARGQAVAPRASSRQALPSSNGGTAAPAFDRALLDKYCVSCHSEARKAAAAGLALDHIDTMLIGDNARVWEKVAAKLR